MKMQNSCALLGFTIEAAENGFVVKRYDVEADQFSFVVAKTPTELESIISTQVNKEIAAMNEWAARNQRAGA